jgi:predicted lipoprotein with Yx(FWY)xxD motif
MTRNLKALVLTMAVLAIVVAGCGSDSSSSETGGDYGGSETGGAYGGKGSAANEESTASEGSAANVPSSGSQGSGGVAVVAVDTVPKLGKVIVNSEGLTLYDFHKDKGTTSSCYGGCAALWPPLTTEGKPTGQMGVTASKLGTTERKDGTTQVTFAGHPLYTYTADSKPGEANGNDFESFGAEWYALTPSGKEP